MLKFLWKATCLSLIPAEQGCIEDFENTASFSRRYQAAQDCMCDSEHMFDCPSFADSADDTIERFNELDFNQFLQHTMQVKASLGDNFWVSIGRFFL